MKALVYDITSFEHAGFEKGYGDRYSKGYAYETKAYFIHFWSYKKGITLQSNIPITEEKQGDNLNL